MVYLENIPGPSSRLHAAPDWYWEQLAYRVAMRVTAVRLFRSAAGEDAYPVCPRCRETMEREYMSFCSRCGQRLDWRRYQQANVIYVEPGDHTVHKEHSIPSR